SGHLLAQHQTDVSKGDLGGQPGKARSRDCARTRQTEVLVDDDNPIGRPPKLTGLMRQGVLSIGRLAVVLNLGGTGLAQIDDGHAGKVTGVDLLDVTHRLSPALSRPRASAR